MKLGLLGAFERTFERELPTPPSSIDMANVSPRNMASGSFGDRQGRTIVTRDYGCHGILHFNPIEIAKTYNNGVK